jgi:hypothetical protein
LKVIATKICLFALIGLWLPAIELLAQQPTVPITKVSQIRALTLDEAKRGLPVHLRAVVNTIGDDKAITIFIEDETGGTFLALKKADWSLEHGMVVDIIGRTYAEYFVPGIQPDSIKVIGRGGTLRPPTPANYDDLLYGKLHYQRVNVTGVVRSVKVETNRLTLQVALGPRKLEVRSL